MLLALKGTITDPPGVIAMTVHVIARLCPRSFARREI
jgi:hypothetical protein